MALETQTEKKPFMTVENMMGILQREGERLEAENAQLTETNKLLTADIKAKENKSKDLDSQVQIKTEQNTAELSRLANGFQKEKTQLEKDVVPLRATVADLQGQVDNARREVTRIADSKKDEIRSQTREAQAELDRAAGQRNIAVAALTSARAQLGQLAQAIQKVL